MEEHGVNQRIEGVVANSTIVNFINTLPQGQIRQALEALREREPADLRVAITSPDPREGGIPARITVRVEATGNRPPAPFLWLGVLWGGQYWPSSHLLLSPVRDSASHVYRWSEDLIVGGPADYGREFGILVLYATDNANSWIDRHRAACEANHSWPGIGMAELVQRGATLGPKIMVRRHGIGGPSTTVRLTTTALRAMEEEAAGKLWQGERFQELMRARAFFIVCGTWEGAEMYDRYCAYRIAEASVNVGDSYDALVISDRAWSDNAQGYPEAPCIAVGGPVSNSMSAALAKRFRLGDRALGVLAADGRRIGYVWGNDVRDTLEAVDEFLAGTYLQKVLGVAN